MNLKKEIKITVTRDRLAAANEKLTVRKRFKKECIVIDFEKDYGRKLFGCKYGIATILDSTDEMFEKYPRQLGYYVPFIVLPQDIGVVMRIHNRNERKHEKRVEEIVYDYKEKSKCSARLMMKVNEESKKDLTSEEASKNVTSNELRQALGELTEKQQRRVIKHELLGYSLTAIAADEGCSVKAVSDSVIQGMDKLKTIMNNNQE